MTRVDRTLRTVATALVVESLLSAPARTAGRPHDGDSRPPQAPAASPATQPDRPVVAVVVLDAEGRPARGLRAADFEVTVDGFKRAVLLATYVFRGPGAENSARRSLAATPGPVLAEAARAVVVAVDETTLPRGSEGAAAAAVRALLDRLGPSDRVAVVRLPQVGEAMALATDRGPAIEVVRHLTGRASPDRRDLRERPMATNDGEGPLPTRFVTPSDEAAAADPLAAWDALPRLLDRMRNTPGPKTLVVVAGRPAGAPAGPRDETRHVDAAAAGQTVVHVLRLPGSGARPKADLFERIAVESGGSVFDLDRAAERQLDRLMAELGGFYALSLDPAPTGGGGLSDLRVGVRQPGVTAIAARRWTPRGVMPGLVEVARATRTPPTALPESPVSRNPPAPPRDAELDLVLARTAEYVQAYVRDFTRIVAEEQYDQRVEYGANSIGVRPPDGRRLLRSDVLMVSTPDLTRWLPFRDVFEVDGRKIRDREDRLRTLFIDAPAGAAGDARRITQESARYNLGSIDRTINVPTLALECLFPGALARLGFERRGEESIEGVRAWRIDFEERSGPALIRTPDGGNLPASGSFWVDPATGRVVKTTLRTGDQHLKMAFTVLYRASDDIGLWVPVEMRERYERPGETLTATARYSNFRRFRVSTTEDIKRP